MKCRKCGGYDVDLSVDRKYDWECMECGAKWSARKKRAKKAATTTADSAKYTITGSGKVRVI